jgi:pimeloyl-ACP methyl ester carboxylesterase
MTHQTEYGVCALLKKVMKILPAVLVFCCMQMLSFGFSQTDTLVPMGVCLENYTYPFTVKYISLSIQHEEIKMAYMVVDPNKANGRVVLLLHGKNFNGAYWERTARYLAGQGYRIIIPDQIGFGKSFKPTDIQYSFQLLATNTRKLLDSIQVDKVIVLGLSMGGMLATRFTLMFPERVSKLILEDPIGLEDWKIKVPYQTVDQWYQRELQQNDVSLKKYESENYFHGTWSRDYVI